MSGVIEVPDLALRRGGPTFDLVVSKLRPPRLRPDAVPREIVERLARGDLRPVVSVVAPAGFGKTTLLADLANRAERDGTSFAWVSVDERDNDPRVLLAYVATALDRVEPVGHRVFDALASSATSVSGSLVPRLAAAFGAMTSPVVLVIDDVHLLHNRECRSALSVLAENVPTGARLILAGRDTPPLRIARLRAEDRVTEVGPAELSLTRTEARLLLEAAHVSLSPDDVAILHERTEGWPVGLYLAALYLREGGSVGAAAATFGGDDLLVSEYMESEFLERISGSHRAFLTRSAALTSMSGALCDAVLDLPGAASTLVDLARSNLLLVPLDRRGQWYRYHNLFRDMLVAQLERLEPGLDDTLRRRAATWCREHHRPEDAIEYAMAAGDADAVVDLFRELWRPVWWQGRFGTLMRWIQWLDEHGDEAAHVRVAGPAARIAMHEGHTALADRWATAMEGVLHDDAAKSADALAHAESLLARAFMCRHGVEQMRADADEAATSLGRAGIVAPGAQICQGVARILMGDLDDGEVKLEEALRLATEHRVPDSASITLCQQALLAMMRGRHDRADELIEQSAVALRDVGLEDALVETLLARTAMRHGDVVTARLRLSNAHRLLPVLTYANPFIAVQTRLELARIHLGLDSPMEARTMLREIDEIIALRPDLGSLVDEVAHLRASLAGHTHRGSPTSANLTTAELRLLPMLCTHLTYQEIADELFLSKHTIHAQTRSMFRKLGVGTRSEAVARCRELALLDA